MAFRKFKRGGFRRNGLNSKVRFLMKRARHDRQQALADRNFIQYGKNAEAAPTTSVVQRITAVTVGTGIGSRIDMNLTLSNLYYRYNIVSGDATNTVRTLFLQAKGSWPSNPTDADIYRQASGGGSLPWEMPINTEAFHVLVDKLTLVQASDNAQKMIQGTLTRFPKKNLKYGGTTGTSCTAGDIFVVTCSDSGAVTHPLYLGYTKLKYFE